MWGTTPPTPAHRNRSARRTQSLSSHTGQRLPTSSTPLCESSPPPADWSTLVHRYDTFLVLSRAPGWWFVRRSTPDPHPLSGWVPAGALLETSIPVPVPVRSPALKEPPHPAAAPTTAPIAPRHILSTHFPASVLRAYRARGDGEVGGVREGEVVRVYKRYNNWSYVRTPLPPFLPSFLPSPFPPAPNPKTYITPPPSQTDPTQKQHCHSYDEKPLQLWIWLRNTGRHPAFLLRPFDEIKSPISLVRERRRAITTTTHNNNNTSTLHATTSPSRPGAGAAHVGHDASHPRTSSQSHRTTYAVAVFPYWAEAPDELDAAL